MMHEKGGGGDMRVCVCVGGIAFRFLCWRERCVRACVCVDGEGSFGSGRAFPALAWW